MFVPHNLCKDVYIANILGIKDSFSLQERGQMYLLFGILKTMFPSGEKMEHVFY